MEHAHIVYSRTLATMVVLVAVTAVCAEVHSAITLRVSGGFNYVRCQREDLDLRCRVDITAAGIDHFTSLTLFGSVPFRDRNDLDLLVTLDSLSGNANIEGDFLKGEGVSSYGNLNIQNNMPAPYLGLIWPSYPVLTRPIFRCVANGINSDGQAAVISTSIQIETVDANCVKERSQADLTKLLVKMGRTSNLSEKVEAQLVSLDTRSYESKFKCAHVDEIMDHQTESLKENFENLGYKLDNLLEKDFSYMMKKLTDEMDELQRVLSSLEQNINNKLRSLDLHRERFDVSSVYQGRVYLLSKSVQVFSIIHAQSRCLKLGGYLLEVDDNEEMRFVSKFLFSGPRTVHFWTGANDIQSENMFVYFHSKKRVPRIKWVDKQPDNYDNKEHCVEITGKGLNDLPCDSNGKIVCEVPL